MIKMLYSFTIIAILLITGSFLVSSIHLPYFLKIYRKSMETCEQYKVSKNSQKTEIEMEKVVYEIKITDSLIQIQNNRESEIKTSIVEALYLYADSANVKTSKVEIGENLYVEGRHETGISVSGTGNYASMGKFVQLIESYPKSTRVRQIVLKCSEVKNIDGFIDFVLIE